VVLGFKCFEIKFEWGKRHMRVEFYWGSYFNCMAKKKWMENIKMDFREADCKLMD
jgi:hypothetical protein